jgi:hypothetical protein
MVCREAFVGHPGKFEQNSGPGMAEMAIQGRLWEGGHEVLWNDRFLKSLSAYLGMA